MRFLNHFLLLCLLPLAGWAQSSLPPCPKDVKVYWHNCFGTITFPSGSRYVGEFKDNQYNGQGTYTFANGNKYVGEYRDNKYNGQGAYTFANGNKYVGEFRDDKRNGQGTFTFADGNKYVGEFKDDNFDGQGTFTWANGERFVGEFKNNVRNGQGTLTWPDGRTYVGEYKDDRRTGQGTYIFANGAKYVGEHKDNAFNGQGIEYRPDGTVNLSGLWANGSLTRSYALDRNRFPFDGTVQIAVPPVDAGRAERDRLAAEAEAARRMQRELEQRLVAQAEEARRQQQLQERLAQEARERERLVAEARERDRLQAARPTAPRQERRVALVVGNAAYTNQPLANPVNDATDVAASLRAMGFETTLLRDATLAQMRNATRQFADAAASSDVALIFFAGHGIEAKGRNYVIPVGAEIKHEYELEDQAYDASRWLDMLEGIKTGNRQRVNIVILDACRNNELVRSWRSASRGLARMDAPTGTFVAFATAPGKVAGDGAKGQRNSPFTKSLLRAIQSPDVPIELMFKEVRRMVIEETNNDQVPWDNSSLVGDFVFRRTR